MMYNTILKTVIFVKLLFLRVSVLLLEVDLDTDLRVVF